MNQQDPLPGAHPHRGIFVSLVVAIILLIAVFGFFVYSAFFMTTEEPVVDDGKDALITELENEVADLESQLEESMETEETWTLKDAQSFPSFEYPAGWHMSYQTFNGYGPYLWISNRPISRLEASDASPAPIILEVIAEDTAIYAPYESGPEEESYIENFNETNENGVITFTGNLSQESLRPGQYFEEIIFSTSEGRFSLRIDYYPTETELLEGWNIIKQSLLSNIQ